MVGWFGAVRAGDLESIRELLDTEPKLLDLRLSGQRSAAHWFNERSALHMAAKRGHVEIIDFLMERGSKMLDQRDGKWQCPIHLAAIHGQVEAIEALVKWYELKASSKIEDSIFYGPEGNHILFQPGRYDWTPFFWAARKDQWESMETIARLGRECESREIEKIVDLPPELADRNRWISRPGGSSWLDDQDPESGLTALQLAARHGNEGVVWTLIQMGADLFLVDDAGEAPIHSAAEGGHSGIIQILVESGGPEMIDYAVDENSEHTPLYTAIMANEYHSVETLRALGAQELKSESNLTPEQIMYLQTPIPIERVLEIRFETYFDESLLDRLIYWIDSF